jgi:subtilisin family serine protease
MRKAIALNLVLVSLATALAQAASPTTRGRHVSNEILVKFRGTVAGPFEEQLSPGGPVKELGLSRGLGELNTRYKVRKIEPVFKNFGKNRQRLKALLKKDKAGLTKKERHVLERLSRAPKNARVPELGRIYKIQVELEPGQSLEEAVNAFNSDPNVEYAEMNYIVSTCKTPCDNLYPVQWALNNTGQDYPINESEVRRGTADCDIDAPEAWDVNTGSFEVVVAVIDTGVDYGHRDLAWNIWVNEDEVFGNGIDDDDNGYTDDIVGYDFINHDSDPRDDNGHGTHCAGIIAAWGDNFLSIAGVCWNARIMPLKFLSEAGEGQESDAATAIYYAVENGADVTSNSYGGPDYSQTMEEAIAYAHSQGVIMVAAAGNDNTDSAHYPAYHEQMIAVAATDSMDRKAGFSSYGDWVDISAPGVDILSLRGWGTSLGEVYDAFTTILSGTSMACPHLAGVAALTLSQNPQAPTEYVTAKLVTAADDISDKNPDYEGLLGTGRVNAFKAVRDGAEGFITLDKNSYSCNDVAAVKVVDADLTGQPTQDIAVTTGAGDEETMTLVADVNKPWVFTASICTVPGPAAAEDGVLQVGHGQTVTGTYYDSDSGSGIPAVAEASATIDCEPPVVLDVEITYVYSSLAKIIFTTDEPTTASLRCGLACGGPYNIVQHHQTLATKHTFVLSKLQSETTYYFEIEAVDSLGNQTTDDANGQCYAFTTPPTPPPVHVPGQYPTIQEAIDAATTGGTVVIADGIYTGEGNRDLSFGGKAITVRSENGPENCIITGLSGDSDTTVFSRV